MNIAFILYKYFPFGGLQRNMVSIAQACQARGHSIQVYTASWEGEVPPGFNVKVFNISAMTNHSRNIKFNRLVKQAIADNPVDLLVGFNKIPDIDLYYAADPCFAAKAYEDYSFWYRLTPRVKHALEYEDSVFNDRLKTHIMLVSAREQEVFQRYYGTQEERFHVLPPGIHPSRIAPDNAAEIRQTFRREEGINDDEKLLLALGSGFKTKGVDRTLEGVKSLPQHIRQQTKLFIIGQDNPKPFQKAAQALGIGDRVSFFPGREDVPRILLGADLLVHPAYRENTGNVLLEAMVAGLPVLTTDSCGYAHYVSEANMGMILPTPFQQELFNQALLKLLQRPREEWQDKGQQFAQSADIYQRPQHAADIIELLGQEKK